MTLRYNLFFTVHSLRWSRSLDPEARVYFLQCASFDGVSLIDPEARIYFLQCAYFSGVDLFDPEAFEPRSGLLFDI